MQCKCVWGERAGSLDSRVLGLDVARRSGRGRCREV